MSQHRKIALLLFLWMCFHATTLELFVWFDWEAGVQRGAALVFMVIYAALLFRNRSKLKHVLVTMRVQAWQRYGVGLVAAVLMAVTVYAGVQSWVKADREDFIPGDMGRSMFQSYRALQTGQSPYGQRVIVDFQPLLEMKKVNEAKPFCFHSEGVATFSNLARYWDSLDVNLFDAIVPKVSNDERCMAEKQMLASLGLKYGPAMLTLYVPFIGMWGKGGIFAANLFYLMVFTLLAFFRGPQIRHANFWVAGCFLVMLFGPTHIRSQGLVASANDLLPLGWAIMGYYLLKRKQTWLFGAFCLSLSFSAKFLPGLFFLPFLLRTNLRTMVVFGFLVLLWFAPFWVWDSQGLWNNLMVFMLHRPSDSTALAHYLPPAVVVGLQVLVGVGLVVFALKTALKSKCDHSDWLFVLLGMCALLFAGKILHNNYILWVQVVFGFAVFTWLADHEPSVPGSVLEQRSIEGP